MNNENTDNDDANIKVVTINYPNNYVNEENTNQNGNQNDNQNGNQNSNRNQNIKINKIDSETENSSSNNGIAIDLFNNSNEDDVLVVDTEEAVSKEERVIRNDIILEKDLENSLMKSLPLFKQNNILVQREISRRANFLVKLKNEGVAEFEKGDHYYSVKDDYENNIYNTNWIIPIIADKQIKYGNELEQYTAKMAKNSEFLKYTSNYNSTIYKDRNVEIARLKDYKKRQFNVANRLYFNEVEPYRPDDDLSHRKKSIEKNTTYYSTKVNSENKENLPFIRLSNFDNILWTKRTVSMATEFCEKEKLEIYGEDEGGLQSELLGAEEVGAPKDCETTENYKSRQVTLIPADKINVVGFYIAPLNKTIDDFKQTHLKNIGKIQEIKNNILYIKDHGLNTHPLVKGEEPYNLPRDIYVLIKGATDNNSRINGIYNNIKIIDKDHIYLDMKSTTIDFKNNQPELYGPGKLDYQLCYVSKDGKVKLQSNGEDEDQDKEYSIHKATICLFESESSTTKSMKEDVYRNIVKSVLPSINDILTSLFENTDISNSISISELNKYLNKYRINYDELRLYQFDKIQKIIEKNIEDKYYKNNISLPIKDKYTKLYKYIEDSFDSDNNKNNKTNNTTNNTTNNDENINKLKENFINKELLSSKKITDYYGDYKKEISENPNTSSFIEWLTSKLDFGKLYINYLLLQYINKADIESKSKSNDTNNNFDNYNEKNNKNNKSGIGFSTNNIRTVKRQIFRIEKELSELEKESSVNTFFKNNEECGKKKTKTTCNFDEKSIINEDDINMKSVSFDDLKCIYDDVTGKCRSKKSYRVDEKIKDYKEKLEKYKELEKDLSNDTIRLKIQTNITKYTALFTQHRYLYDNQKKTQINKEIMETNSNVSNNDVNSNENNSNDNNSNQNNSNNENSSNETINQETQLEEKQELQEQKEALNQVTNSDTKEYDTPSYKIYKLIQEIDDTFLKQQLLFQLIEKDGIIINNFYHSKKYGHPLFCSHWRYVYMIDSNDGDYSELYTEMTSIYGDNGEADLGTHSCKFCGVKLANMKLSEVERFNDYGERVKTREIWTFGKEDEQEGIYDCDGKEFKDFLVKAGITEYKDIEMAKELCSILGSIQRKIGVILTIEDSEYIINQTKIFLDNMRKKIPPFDIFKKQLIQKVGLSKIRKLLTRNTNYISDEYNKYKYMRIYPVIASLVLIKIQISCPRYEVSNRLTSCIFRSFDDELGQEYMLCVIGELLQIRMRDEKKLSIILSFFERGYNYFSNFYDISKSLTECRIQKDKKQSEMRNRQNRIKMATSSNQNQESLLDTNNLDLGAMTKQELKTILGDIKETSNKEGVLLKALITQFSTLVREQELYNPFDIVSSCCVSSEDKSYDDYFTINNNNSPIPYIKQQLKEIEEIKSKLIKFGANSRLLISKPLPKTPNTPISLITLLTFPEANKSINLSDLYNQMFKSYCHQGYTEGEYHDFYVVSSPDKSLTKDYHKCIKCSDILEELENREFTKEEFTKLRYAITKKTTRKDIEKILQKYRNRIINIFNARVKSFITLSKKEIGIAKKTFVNNLARLMGESKNMEFKNKYTNLIDTLGSIRIDVNNKNPIVNYNTNNKNNINDNSKENIEIKKKQQQINALNQRIANLKEYINEYFRQYISIITNKYDRNNSIKKIVNTTKTEMEKLTKKISERNNMLSIFLTDENSNLFDNEKFNFDFSIEQIDLMDIDEYSVESNIKISYDKVIEDKNNVITLLQYLLLEQLNKMMETNKGVVAEFIIKVFDIIYQDSEFFTSDIDEIDNEILYHRQLQTRQRQLKYEEYLLERERDKYKDIDDEFDDTEQKRELEEKRKALASLISSDYPVDGEMVDELIEDEQEDNNIMADFVIQQEKIENEDALEDVDDYGDIPEDEDYEDQQMDLPYDEE